MTVRGRCGWVLLLASSLVLQPRMVLQGGNDANGFGLALFEVSPGHMAWGVWPPPYW